MRFDWTINLGQLVTAAVFLFGVMKLYWVLYEHPPHSHRERGEAKPLTTDGINYPRGTRRD